MDAKNDKTLVEKCVTGDAGAWELLISRYSPLMLTSIKNRLRRYGFDPACEDIDEIRQNTVTMIWRENKLEGVRNRDSIACWLSMVAGNMAISHMRKKLSYAPSPMPIANETDEEAVIRSISAKSDICEELDRKEAVSIIEESIDALPPKEKLVAKLHLLYGKKFHDISDMLQMPIGSVSSYAKRAKAKLKENLKKLQ